MIEARGTGSLALQWVVLDKHVLLVDLQDGTVNRGAYVGAVEGKDYHEEALSIPVTGSLVWESLSELYFGSGKGPMVPILGKDLFFPSEGRKYVERLMRGQLPTEDPSILDIRPLDKHVLVVASARPGNTWRAFIGAIAGVNLEREAPSVVATGSEITFELAELCFEDLAKATKFRGAEWYIPPPSADEVRLRSEHGPHH